MNNDFISRKEVLSVLEKVFNTYNIRFGGNQGGFAEAIPKAIQSIPAADDKDKIVKRLEELKDYANEKAAEYEEAGKSDLVAIYDAQMTAYKNAIKFIKNVV